MNHDIEPLAGRPVTLHRVAVLLGCSTATVSRLRAGDRQPSFLLMAHVETVLGWPMEQQARARIDKRWHLEFETALQRHFAEKGPGTPGGK